VTDMPARSKAQQKAAGAALSAKRGETPKGELKGASKEMYASMSEEQAESFARMVWSTINGVNLREEILPTRARADLVLEKGRDHRVRRVRLRKL